MLLSINDLHLHRGGTHVLRGVNLACDAGDIYGLLGPNGAGKSTTIAAMLGLLPPHSGTVRVLGRNPQTDARAIHGALGVLPERFGFYDWMTASEYLDFFSRLYERHPASVEIDRKLATVGLSPKPGQIIGMFSRGMRQRLALARALLPAPKLLILDEPTNGLDPRGRRELHDLLRDLAGQGIGILLCTHLLDDVDRLCGRIGILMEGRTVIEGAVSELLDSQGGRVRYRIKWSGELPPATRMPRHVSILARDRDAWLVEIEPGLPAADAWREMLFAGWPVAEVMREGGGLESLYLTMTEGRPT
ncbi:ABC transporter related protein [Solidesulfovibrio fructosivorans JJ]]|uniref:ABC transporter related protein n=1 Tax=Solidesulfovibrio fructosivorans JJ] TaxID=596151 RepID=E1JWW5_SOLFR|nr:ABC transporter ATP-binding protein [Solidesulfovibrio fructosivorans]EFL51169.1 ABC transporter related protein [Solidesulfovibrio fructosivorans JJ]]